MNLLKLQKNLLQAISNDQTKEFIKLCEDSSLDSEKLYNLSLNKLSQSCVHLACIYGRLEILKYIWEHCGCNHSFFVTKDSCYKEPLHHASQHGNHACVQWLLNHITDININSMKKADWTPLMLAVLCKSRTSTEIYEIVDNLLSYGADPTLKNKDGWTALHLSCKFMNIDIVKRISQAAPQCCIMNSLNGRTPLHTACLNGNIAVVQYLVINFYPNVNKTDDCGVTPLMDALVGGFIDICAWLLENSDASLDCFDRLGRHTIHIVCQNGPLNSVSFLIDRYPNLVTMRTLDGNGTPLLSAAKMKNVDIVKYLLNHGADQMEVDNVGRTYEFFL